MADLRKNRVKHKLNSGESAVVLMGLDSSDAIEQCGPGDHDGVWLEGEHGGVDQRVPNNADRVFSDASSKESPKGR